VIDGRERRLHRGPVSRHVAEGPARRNCGTSCPDKARLAPRRLGRRLGISRPATCHTCPTGACAPGPSSRRQRPRRGDNVLKIATQEPLTGSR